LGGVTTFLFASVVAAGIKVISYIKFTRKDRFILAASASLGFGNMLVPTWADYLFADVQSPSAGLQGLFNSIIIVISTPYLVAGLVASILYQILPDDAPEGAVAGASFVESGLEEGEGAAMHELPRQRGMEEDKEEDYKARVEPTPSGSKATVEIRDA
jgi:hypothetical protein